MNKVKVAPACSIFHVLGYVGVPNTFPSSDNPMRLNNKARITIITNDQFLMMY